MNCKDIRPVEELLDNGNRLAMQGNFQGAIAYYDQGLEELGSSYAHEGLLDDTNLKLIVATDALKNKEFQRAAKIKERVLESRIAVFKNKYPGQGAGLHYHLYPESFESLITDRTTELGAHMSNSSRTHALLPPFPRTAQSALVLTAPDRLVVVTADLSTFSWQLVQLPIAFVTMLNTEQQRRFYEQYIHMRDVATGKEFTFFADVQKYDLKMPAEPSVGPDGAFMGEPVTYDILYFSTGLPLYSATYDVHVRIADVRSNICRIHIQLYKNDRLVIAKGPSHSLLGFFCGA